MKQGVSVLKENKRLQDELSVSTQERNDLEHKLIQSDHDLAVVHGEFTEATRLNSINFARVQTLLEDSNKALVERTAELAESANELNEMHHERECFTAALHDLKNPLTGSTQILEYIAAGKVAPEQQAEILKQIIASNKQMLSGAERLTAAALALSQRTTQLHNSNIDLIERTEQLAESNAELKTTMQQREDFVAALTHDLKNPLIGATKVLEVFVAGTEVRRQDEQDKILNLVIESNKSMLRMIWNMLDVYRQEAGFLVPVLETVSVSGLLKHCLSDLSFNIQDKNLKLIFDASVELPPIQTDRILLRRVLSNVLDNAVKFSPEGGELIVTTDFDDKLWSISVKDSGEGMADKQLEQIFQRFWQTKHGREKGIGTGLGLFSSKQIMNALQGSIECKSVENCGTTFTVSLPFTEHVIDYTVVNCSDQA